MGNRGGMAQEPTRPYPLRGEVYVVDFDPAFGSELGKTRPAVVLQHDVGNRFSATTIVAAISSRISGRRFPTQVVVRAPEGGLRTDSGVHLDQIRTLDMRRLGRRLGDLERTTMARVEFALRRSLGLG